MVQKMMTINKLVRISILSVSFYLLVVIILAWNGTDLYQWNYIFGHNLILDLLFLFFCFNDKKYHCKYMRFMCYNLIFTDLIGFIDAQILLFRDAVIQLIVLSVTWSITTLITFILAIGHFYKVKKINKEKYES